MRSDVSGGMLDPAGYRYTPYVVPLLVTAAATLLLGISALIRERASRLSLLFGLIPLAIDVWLCAFSLMFCSSDARVALMWARAGYLGVPFIPSAIYHFSVAATNNYANRRRLVWGGWFVSVLSSGLFLGTNLLMDGLYRYPWGYYPRFRWSSAPYLLFFVGMLALSLKEHWSDSQRARTERHRLRSRSYLIAFAIGSIGCVDYIGAYGIPVYPFGYLPVLVFVALTARAIRRYRLADITPAFAAPQILSTMTDSLIAYDAEGSIRLVNQATAALLGHEEAALIGTHVSSHVDVPAGGPDHLSRLGELRQSRDEEGTLKTRGGERVDVSVSVSPLEDAAGLVAGAVLIARDIRERKAAETALRASEERYRHMFEGNPQPMWVHDVETLGFLAVNVAAMRHYGYSRQEFLGMTLRDIYEDSAALTAQLSQPRATIEGGIYRHRKKDGTLLWAEINAHEMTSGGRRARFVLAYDVTDQHRAEETLRQSEARFRALAETEAAAVFILEGDCFRYINPGLRAITGLSEEELLRLNFWLVAHPESQTRFKEIGLASQRAGAGPARFEMRLSTRREPRWADVTVAPIEIEGRPAALATAFDITERKLAEEALRESERRLRDILDNIQLISLLLDANGDVTYCNEYLLDLVGCSEDEVVGQNWFDLFVPEDQRGEVKRAFLERFAAGDISPHDDNEILTTSGERRRISWNNTVLRDLEGKLVGTACLGADITDRVQAEQRLAHGALHDALTGLPNRTLFMDRLAGCMARAKRRANYHFAALFLDVDRFKVVNEGLGHLTGDQLLVQIARRLETCLRPGDSVARLGGDEFAVLIDDVAEAEVPARVADRIQGALSVPFELAGREVFLTASIGIALSKQRYHEPEDILRDAGTAMHHAKEEGRARHREFNTAMHARAVGRLQIENDLHRAIERHELCAHYQPILNLKTGGVAGFEALVRWQRPEHGLVMPNDFIRVAEETGLIVPIGLWVLREACTRLRKWQAEFPAHKPLMVSVNLSGRQFEQRDLVTEVGRTVRETGLGPGSLKLEITESVLMEDPETAAAMLTELKALGVHVCIDDFGTGYSSLSYLLRFPANTLKIDRAFVSGMASGSQHSDMVVRAIIALARNLGMDVIAEGVEIEEQLVQLKALDCDFIQGYLFSKPLDAEGALALLRREPSLLHSPYGASTVLEPRT
jgi:diguanylate cyclase (GGDEF)-like protein/PAS domain S-box-containing protein